MQTLGDRIKERREAKGWTQEKLADEVGVGQGAIWKWETNQVTDIRKLRKVAEVLDTSEEYLEHAVGPAHVPHESTSNVSQLKPGNRGIPSGIRQSKTPVYGPAAAGAPDRILLTEDFVVEEVDTPNELIGVRDAFIMYVAGDSMRERYRHNDLVSVNRNKFPAIGQDCVVVLAEDGNVLVKEFVGETDNKSEWKFKQHNPSKTLKYKKSEVRAIYAIVGRPS